jgi:predicted ArsR family transcriptional regulator
MIGRQTGRIGVERWDQRFFSSTRGQIVALLRRAGRTVDELAGALDLTDNGVRAHLTSLERDGLVRQGGVRRGSRKPSRAYEQTAEAEQLFRKPYGPVLRVALEVLAERMAPEELEGLLREVGRRMGARQAAWSGDHRVGHAVPSGDPRERLESAVSFLNELGGLAELDERDGAVTIRGYSCPLAEVVPGHPEACALAASALTEVMGVPVRERCDRADPVRCAFDVAAGA